VKDLGFFFLGPPLTGHGFGAAPTVCLSSSSRDDHWNGVSTVAVSWHPDCEEPNAGASRQSTAAWPVGGPRFRNVVVKGASRGGMANVRVHLALCLPGSRTGHRPSESRSSGLVSAGASVVQSSVASACAPGLGAGRYCGTQATRQSCQPDAASLAGAGAVVPAQGRLSTASCFVGVSCSLPAWTW